MYTYVGLHNTCIFEDKLLVLEIRPTCLYIYCCGICDIFKMESFGKLLALDDELRTQFVSTAMSMWHKSIAERAPHNIT